MLAHYHCLCSYKNALGGMWVVSILFFCYALTEVLRISSSTWLSVWTDQGSLKIHGAGYYNLIYGILSFGQVFIAFVNFFDILISLVSV